MTSPTLGRPYAPVPAPSAKRRGVLLPVVGLVVLALLAVITLGVLQRAIGTPGVVVGTLAALLPVVPVVAAFLWVDRWEPEPPRMLMGAFLWGAGFAALVALLINTSASAVLDAAAGRGAGDLFGPVVVAPVVEEFTKGLFLIGLLLFRRREFDGIVDGVVYAGIVAAGFAFSENILYLGRAVSEPESAGVLATLFVRGVASPFAHPLFTCMIGIAAGIAAASRSIGVRVLAMIAGYIAAVVLHALWNGASVLAATPGGFYQIYLFVMVPIFVGLILLVVFARRREARIVAAQLPGFAAAGWIAPSEVPLLARLSRRRGWRTLVRRRSGPAAAKAVADYQSAVTELAFMRNRIARGAVRESAHALHDEKLAALLRARAVAVGVPEALVAAWARQRPSDWEPPPPAAPDGSFSGQFRIPTFPDGGGSAAAGPPVPPLPPGPVTLAAAAPWGRPDELRPPRWAEARRSPTPPAPDTRPVGRPESPATEHRGRHHDDPSDPGPTRPMRRPDDEPDRPR
ncbi:putative integral membrane protein [Pseudonocardia sp. Ae406_Ps2]|uniref:PrsW family intramembrane metalloprotease n=1 Tax=unclassified Pseudonocardia TaxID=2619320 RepID=UPI00094AE680|nr:MULTISPECIES: PrsW family intramembrane metalloprotease [unclassified Pseudonocardia]OLL98099.1 putative integral membrane protein [Pseudonocardia sp. Ae331_Ps2]OLM04193.1 putative integral membrane protein [Pseudonocardia sp. Ae406_Ps2]OLM25744.1 putative integral membrane protein [Pseudonocardia sp. Ae706_Ps2]